MPVASAVRVQPVQPSLEPRIAFGLVGLVVAVSLRVAVSGADGAGSLRAGLVFAAVVGMLALALRVKPVVVRWSWKSVAYGVAGAVVLCVPAAVRHVDGGVAVSAHGYARWAFVVVLVAVAEECLLRGSLFTAVRDRAGLPVAIGLSSVAFALLHVPLYGWSVVPLDLAVGVWLGVLRTVTGSVTAPATAHALADLAGWWLR